MDNNIDHVLFIIPSDGGGMLHYGSQLSNGMADHVRVEVITDEGADLSMFDPSVRTRQLDFPNAINELGADTIRVLAETLNIAGRDAVDIVHLTVMNPLFIPVLAGIREKTTVVTCHDVWPHPGDESLRERIATEGLVRVADQIAVHGDYNRSEFINRFGAGHRLIRISHGSYEFFRRCCDDRIRYDPELLFFGRIRPYKGVGSLLAAESAIAERVSEFEITVAGKGSLPVDKSNIGENTTILNKYISNERVCELFSRCRAVVLPYVEASQSGVIPIAYSFGKPVIATPVGGIPEVVENDTTGILVDNQDELVEACVGLLKDDNRARELGQHAREYAQREMDWTDICERLKGQYA